MPVSCCLSHPRCVLSVTVPVHGLAFHSLFLYTCRLAVGSTASDSSTRHIQALFGSAGGSLCSCLLVVSSEEQHHPALPSSTIVAAAIHYCLYSCGCTMFGSDSHCCTLMNFTIDSWTRGHAEATVILKLLAEHLIRRCCNRASKMHALQCIVLLHTPGFARSQTMITS